jgi:TetR/AcrR family transcriptional regulator, transcriptional repressor for nem operon
MARASLKEQLVDRSAAVFLERGFNAASVNDIVQAAGVPKGSFYNHFASKEALAIEVLRRYVDDLGLRELAEPGDSPLEQIRAHLKSNIAAREAAGIEYGCLLGNLSTDAVALNEGLREAVTQGFARWVDALASAIARAQSAGEIRNTTDPHSLARYLVASFEGAIAQAKTLRSGDPINDFLAVTFDTVLN